MTPDERIVKEVQAALERDPLVEFHNYPVTAGCDDGMLTLEGHTPNIAAKKLTLEVAAAVPGVAGIVDRVRVVPAEPMEDGEIRNHVCDALLQDGVFNEYTIRALVKEAWETIREAPAGETGIIEVEVRDGVVTLNGMVASLSHKRTAGVFAWWVPGSRDVVNGIDIVPPEEDNDDEVRDAVRLVLEKDPFVNASQITVTCADYVVTLDGLVLKPLEREMAASDAWYIFGVGKVINKIEVAE